MSHIARANKTLNKLFPKGDFKKISTFNAKNLTMAYRTIDKNNAWKSFTNKKNLEQDFKEFYSDPQSAIILDTMHYISKFGWNQFVLGKLSNAQCSIQSKNSLNCK